MPNFSHEYFMQVALKQAQMAFDADEVPVGAIIVINNQIVARAHNQTVRLTDSTAHAEILALTAIFHKLGSRQIPQANVYVTLEPCLMCCGALFWARPAAIIYGASDEKFGYSKFISPETKKPFHPKTKVIPNVLADEAATLLKVFFSSKR
jgi:tRNA(adenine34) deaminase